VADGLYLRKFKRMQFGVIGSGSWATAIAKILTDNEQNVNWLMRTEAMVEHIKTRKHNPNYLSAAYFDINRLGLSTDIAEVVYHSETVVMAVPSAYLEKTLEPLEKDALNGKKVVSAIKGILPTSNQLLNDYLHEKFNLNFSDYFTLLGPCHAEEVATEKLSYLTFSGEDLKMTQKIADAFKTPYMNTVVNHDVLGVQYAAVLKNIYALGAGIAHGLDYGDNFLSVFITNCADEMIGFLRQVIWDKKKSQKEPINYATSVYLGDLLVTCYSLFSRNRTFGAMIGKGYSVKAAQVEMNMVAEGYNASKSIHIANQTIKAKMPIAETIYQILWQNLNAREGFDKIEQKLV
jgi:glycerol-3-phosphate dehydrogenase (NAD(P)+)